MHEESYRRLIREVAQCAGLSANDPFLETGLMNVDGLDTLLFYDEEFDPERLQIRIDFGSLPTDLDELRMLTLSLLSVNFDYGMGGLAVFSVNPSNAHVILTTQHTLHEYLTAQDLLASIRNSNAQARFAWEEANSKVSR